MTPSRLDAHGQQAASITVNAIAVSDPALVRRRRVLVWFTSRAPAPFEVVEAAFCGADY
ncbi:MAG: hypothetical protein R3F49_10215 [Planctomycetota bacterium]